MSDPDYDQPAGGSDDGLGSDEGQPVQHITASQQICGAAKLLGIDPVNEPGYLWLCENALLEDNNDEQKGFKNWKECKDKEGNTVYYNAKGNGDDKATVSTVHPVIDYYTRLYQKTKSYTKHMTTMGSGSATSGASKDQGGTSKLNTIIQEVKNRQNLKLPVATPDIIKKLCDLLDIDYRREFYLFRVVKTTLEAYVEKKFDLKSFVEDLKAPVDQLRDIRAQQVKVDVIKKPESVIMCQECEDYSAVVKCEQCRDFFCQDCFNKVHATGKRRGHITSDVEQLVCAPCDVKVATRQCIQCGLFYCDQCYRDIHETRTELQNHFPRILNGLVCLECEHYNASVVCEDCVDLFCTECFIKLHRKGARRNHVHLTIDNTGQIFRGGFLVAPEEASRYTERARSTVEAGGWVPFKNDQGITYSFHCLDDRVITHSGEEDVQNRPAIAAQGAD